MPKLRKANRVVEVPKNEVDSYKQRGYDVIDDNGKVKDKATGGKDVSVVDYNRLVEENENLKSQLARTNDIDTDQYDVLEKQNKKLEAEVADLKEEVKSYEEENIRLDKELKARNKK